MSHMKITPEEDNRMKDSRNMLFSAFNIAMGSYIEQEAKKIDSWRDQNWGELYAHAKHEFIEMSRSKSYTTQLHNAIDLVMLNTMLLCKLLERERES